jgi:hypothetical protein
VNRQIAADYLRTLLQQLERWLQALARKASSVAEPAWPAASCENVVVLCCPCEILICLSALRLSCCSVSGVLKRV